MELNYVKVFIIMKTFTKVMLLQSIFKNINVIKVKQRHEMKTIPPRR